MEILGRIGNAHNIILGRVTDASEDGDEGTPRYYACIPLDPVPEEPGASFGKRWELTLNRLASARPTPVRDRRPRKYARK